MQIPYRLDIYELLNRTSSRIVRVAAASGVAQEFRIVLSPKVKIKNSTSSVYSRLYGNRFLRNGVACRKSGYFTVVKYVLWIRNIDAICTLHRAS